MNKSNRPPILIVVANFYGDIAEELVLGANNRLKTEELKSEIIEVPGVFEIPAVVAMAFDAHPHNYDGVIALGCVIRGETTHYDYVCSESARGLMNLSIKHALPMGYGILTCENKEQATRRAHIHHGNKGGVAAEACLKMLEIKEKL